MQYFAHEHTRVLSARVSATIPLVIVTAGVNWTGAKIEHLRKSLQPQFPTSTRGWAKATICFTPLFLLVWKYQVSSSLLLQDVKMLILLEIRLPSLWETASRSVCQGYWTLLVCPKVRINLLMFVKSYVNDLYHADRSSTALLTGCSSWQLKIHAKQCLLFQTVFTDVFWLA